MDDIIKEISSFFIFGAGMLLLYRVEHKNKIKRMIKACFVDIDNINRDDPNEIDINTLNANELESMVKYCSNDNDRQLIQANANMPSELLYGIRMSITLDNFIKQKMLNNDENYSIYCHPAVYIACRAQHIGRWKVPRSSFPEGRTSMYRYHADLTKNIMKSHGFDDVTVAKAENMIMKKNIKGDLYSQMLEDVALLVFLKSYFTGFLAKYNHFQDEKVVDIVKKCWNKMSDDAHAEALKLPLNNDELAIVKKALGL